MERLARFVVEKRKLIYVVTAIATLLAALAIPFVTINSDMTRYLPEQSRIRQGLDAMNADFAQVSPLEVMYTDLNDEQVEVVADDLAALPNVDSVVYKRGTDGNANKVLFTVNLAGDPYSSTATEGLAEVRAYTEGSNTALAGTVLDNNDQLTTLGITIVLAVGILLAILFTMCASWVEPVPFMIAIGVAIVLNMGTNIVFPNVSNMTFSVAAVLQLALSMDYSIMLMDRYRQERAQTDDKEKAMVRALGKGFTSIASSSVTTIAGMLCLVVMTFTIGRDMGLVLAKGVAFSLLCVLLFLPGLIVSFDGAIQKTPKRAPRPKLTGLAHVSYAYRYVILGVFVVVLVGGFVAKGSAGISFFMESSNDDQAVIDRSFAPTEQVVVLYDGSGAPMAEALEDIAALPGVETLQAFETTLGKPYTASELAESLDMDPMVVSALFYDYQGGTVGRMTVAQFASFVRNDLGSLGNLSGMDQDELNAQMDRLMTFADPASIREERSVDNMAQVLSMDPALIEQLYLYYFVQNGGIELGTMTLPEFVSFVQSTVATDPQMAASMGDAELAQITQLAKLTNVDAVTAPLDAASLAATLGLDQALVEQVYQLKAAQSIDPSSITLTVPQVLATLVDTIMADPVASQQFDDTTRAQLTQLRAVADASAAGTELAPADLAALLGMDAAQVEQLFQLAGVLWGLEGAPATMTLPTFLAFVLDSVATNPDVAASLDPALAQQFQALAPQLAQVRAVADASAAGTPLDAASMASTLGIDAAIMDQIYLAAAPAPNVQMSVQEFLTFVLDSVASNPQFAGSFDQAALAQLYQARALVDATVAGTSFGPGGMAEILGGAMDLAQLEQIYLLHAYQTTGADSWTLSLNKLVPFLVGEASTGQLASQDAVDPAQITQLEALNTIMQESLTGVMYTPEAMADLLAPLSDDLNANQIDLLYLLEAAQTEGDPTATMTLEQFVSFVADDVAQDPRFADALDSETIAELEDAKQVMADNKGQLVGDHYLRALLEVSYDRDSDQMRDLLSSINTIMASTGASYHVVGDAPMGVEMQDTFGDELNFITLLTALVIFVIVAITFRSFFVPLVLVLLIQTAINLTMGISLLQGIDTYYIALMVVQALLMGATIDYAILFTSYYRDLREHHGIRESLERSFRGSVGTIMTSSSILILVTFVVGLTNSDVTIAEVCLTISKGSLVAVTLVMLLLPGTLAALDRFVAGPKRSNPDGTPRLKQPQEQTTSPDEQVWPELADIAVAAPGKGVPGSGTNA